MTISDVRFESVRYSVPQASDYLGVPYGTLRKWANGYRNPATGHRGPTVGKPIIHASPPEVRGPRLTFAALVEAQVITALRQGGLSLQSLRRVTRALRQRLNEDPWALASKRLYVSGADVLWNHAEDWDDEEAAELVEVVSGQRVFTEAVRQYLERIEYLDDYAGKLYLPVDGQTIAEIDPFRNFGEPTFTVGGAPVRVVLGRLTAGGDPEAIARDFGVPISHLRSALPHASSLAA